MAEYKIKFKPWKPPNFAQLERLPGRRIEEPSIPITQLDASTLSELCDEWRVSVFERAGKEDPKAARPRDFDSGRDSQ